MAITASEARKNLFPLLAQVNNDRAPVEIMSRHGDAVLISREEYLALEETAHLLRPTPVGSSTASPKLTAVSERNTRSPDEARLHPKRVAGLHPLALSRPRDPQTHQPTH
ncbi:MAG: type II toxin-antitoxin system Phd/YefM family antitoxin [Pseudonocardiaceae bacterium]